MGHANEDASFDLPQYKRNHFHRLPKNLSRLSMKAAISNCLRHAEMYSHVYGSPYWVAFQPTYWPHILALRVAPTAPANSEDATQINQRPGAACLMILILNQTSGKDRKDVETLNLKVTECNHKFATELILSDDQKGRKKVIQCRTQTVHTNKSWNPRSCYAMFVPIRSLPNWKVPESDSTYIDV